MIPRGCYPDLMPRDIAFSSRERSTNVNGNVSDFEIDIINRLVRFTNPNHIFEIGTFDGRTTLNMAANSGPQTRIFTLDLPPSGIDNTALAIDAGDRLFIDKPASGARFVGTDVSQKITQLYGDSATYDFAPYAGKIDFVFVDGSHSYNYVKRDSLTALNIRNRDGIILWHDYVPEGPSAWPGLTVALNELHDGDARFKGMMHIAGTAIVVLGLHSPSVSHPLTSAMEIYGDSGQPEFLLSKLDIQMNSRGGRSGELLFFSATVTNTGRTTWLPSNAAIGPVRLGTRLLDSQGTYINPDYSRHFLPAQVPVLPGQTVRFGGEITCPPPGNYTLEFDMVADGVAWFARNGSTAVRVDIQSASRN